MLADFYIIGAMKSATSTLAAQLSAQEKIFVTTPKEPNFFSDDAIFAKGMSWYRDLFKDAPSDHIKGEASTHYTKWPDHPKAPERLKAVTPNAKFIYLIRDPLDRAISHYRHEWTQGVVTGSPDQAARTLPALWQYSCYDLQLQKWFDHFDKDQFLIITAEGLRAHPQENFRRILQFLGAQGEWKFDLENANQSSERFKRLPFQNLLLDNPVATALRRTLVPKSLRTKIREARKPSLQASFTEEAESYLKEKIEPD
ncbi:MAG: sulfotransferase, partial [Pseudomonadota bacterium]